MNARRLIVGLLAAMVFASCSHTTKNGGAWRDTLEYRYKTVIKKAPDLTEKIDTEIDLVKIKYPKFDVQALDDTLCKLLYIQLFSQFNNFKPTTSVEEYVEKNVNVSSSYMRKGVMVGIKPYCITINVEVVSQDSSFTAIELYRNFDTERFCKFLNWDNEKNKAINLNDIFVDNYRAKLNAVAEAVLKKQEESVYKDRIDKRRYYELHPNSFSSAVTFFISNNFLITKSGLKFIYNYGDWDNPLIPGQTELFIPYHKIATLLRPKTVIQQYK